MAVLVASDDPHGEPLVALGQVGDWVAVGMVRLDNRQELTRWGKHDGTGAPDLELVRRVIAEHGTRYVPDFLGDFAFVAWHASTRTGVAACDAFGVQRLFRAEHDGLIAFASRAEALATREEYEVRYLTERVALRPKARDITVYSGVLPVPAASMVVLQSGRSATIQQYWYASRYAAEASWRFSEQEAAEECRRLLSESIRQRMGRKGETWAQLSGGMDSSSVVSCAQWLAERGECAGRIAGTVTFVDHRGTGTDERAYSGAVVDRWKIPNTTIVDPPSWYDSSGEVPHLDQPSGGLQVYPRDRRLCAIVRQAGGRVLLTGLGGDELFSGTMLFFADWIAQGRVSDAVREMARRAALGRVSFWELAYRNALLPMLPGVARARLVHDQDQVPRIPWVEPVAMRRSGLMRRRAITTEAYCGEFGRKYQHCVAWMADAIENHYHGGIIANSLELRHPMLYRPLVEFALGLPPELRARPHAHRWVLRQAMEGILPDPVRTRVGKPGTGEFLAWSLRRDLARLAPLIHDPILADLGIVEPGKLQAEFDAASRGERKADNLCGPLLNTLAVEAWLRIRSGRWPFGGQSGSWQQPTHDQQNLFQMEAREAL
jgi:asparagine synthase (glutamine-hydrolysing)